MDTNHIISIASAFYESCVLFAASDAGIFEALHKLEEAPAHVVANELKSDPRATRLLMDACVSLSLLVKENDLYKNTPETDFFLVPGSPGDLSKAIRYNRDVYPAWGKLNQFVSSGRPVEKPELHLGDDDERTRNFVLSMHGRALGIGKSVLPQLNFDGCKQMLDVGGGPGTYSVLITKDNPDLNSTVIDLPGVVKIANELIESQGMKDRVKTIPGDYRKTEFPGGNDVVIFFGVLHQEAPDSIYNLFKKAYASLNPGGHIYVMDMMTDRTHTSPKFSALFAVNMALTTEKGWVFSDEEVEDWLTSAGFKDFSVKPLTPPMPHWLVHARKP